ICRPGPAADSLTSASGKRRRRQVPTPRRSTSTKNTSRRAPALPASAARSGSRTRRSEHDPEKWKPVFRKDHAPPRIKSANRFNLKRLRSEHRAKTGSGTAPRGCSRMHCRSTRADRWFVQIAGEETADGVQRAVLVEVFMTAVEKSHEVLRRFGQLEQPLAHRV